MTDSMPFLLRFYGPILIAILLLLFAFVSAKFLNDSTKLHFEPDLGILLFGFKFPLPLWLKRTWVLRGDLLGMSAASLFVAIGTDFSKYFPCGYAWMSTLMFPALNER